MSAKKNERGAGRKKVYAVEMVPVTLNVPENRKEEFRDIWRNWLKSIPGVFIEKGKVSKKAAGGKPSSFLVDESAVFQTEEMREAQKVWPKKKSDAKASNSSNVGVAPEVGKLEWSNLPYEEIGRVKKEFSINGSGDKIDSMLDAALGHIKSEPGSGKTVAAGKNQYYASVTKTIYQNDTNFRVEYPKNKFEFFDYFEDAEEYWNACLEDLKSKS